MNLNKPKNINLFVPLSEYLAETHNIRVATIPPEIKHDTIRYYDPVAKTLVISDRLPQASRTFLVAQQMGLLLAKVFTSVCFFLPVNFSLQFQCLKH